MNMDIWVVGSSSQFFIRLPNLSIFFKKIKQLLEKLHSLWLIYFVLPILFVVTFASDKENLYEDIAFSILVLSTMKRFFLKKVFIFQKICFKVKYWKRSKVTVIVA